MGFLIGTVLVFFVISCVFLILLVLVQAGKGGGLGGMVGGASQTAFGSSSADVLTKATRFIAISFIVVSLLLSFLFAKKEEAIIEQLPTSEIVPAKEDAKQPADGTNQAPASQTAPTNATQPANPTPAAPAKQ
ncbi:MAG TPA: preprotein translocase subunit SecG [Leptospiraceae bacterium]|nr:preprotein translocase subunit SecG [Leptospiraceae bacterium]HMW05352.1 preprotein translocase subunit SecG [Leptospiraceae bacterium]HMX34508.1 preprotein translocase subunit SecG [Leptospiraceae bacterium]HMY31547.1 preprotein translocase subunit SecG [Leptospiraceae bacterium]HNA06701.1 preprotein translocase subunit SecG [Leptospiraceae bacterium]